MVAHRVPFVHHALDELGVIPNIAANNKKCAGRVVLFQRVEDGRGIAVFVSGVKRQIQALLPGIAAIERIVGAQRFGREVRDGRRVFLLKREPPFVLRYGNGLRLRVARQLAAVRGEQNAACGRAAQYGRQHLVRRLFGNAQKHSCSPALCCKDMRRRKKS